MTSSTPFAPFSEWLSTQPVDFLAEILAHRPDVVSPPAKTTQVLAARLQLRASVSRVLPKLALLPLACIEVAADLGADLAPVSASALISGINSSLAEAGVSESLRPTSTQIREALDLLCSHGLVWGNGAGPHGRFVGKSNRKTPLDWEDYFCLIDEAASTIPPGWHFLPSASRPSISDLKAALAIVTPKQQRLLDTLAESGGLGSSKDAAPDADPSLPIPALINAGLLDRVDGRTVRLPATVRALMRGARLHDENVPLRPTAPETIVIAGGDDRGSAAAWETLRHVADLLKQLGSHPATTLKDGTVGVRETRVLCESLGLDIPEISTTVAFASAAGFVHVGTPHPLPANDNGGDYFAPTLEADGFLEANLVDRWVCLALGNRNSDAAPWRVDELSPEGKRIALLSAHSHGPAVPAIREMVFRCCSEATSSTTPQLKNGDVLALADLRAVAAARFPITNARTSDEYLVGVINQLYALGLAVREADPSGRIRVGLTRAGRAFWKVHSATASDADSAVESLRGVLAEMLPPNASYFMVQADNTVVVPGPASPEMEKLLSEIAVLESPGLASVYRITEHSVSSALDSGFDAREIIDFINRFALGEVPQSIQYLLDDVARRHGKLRGGPAASFIRSDDPALIASLLTNSLAEQLGLRKIADTVVISQAPLSRVVDAAREGGFSIIAEDANGLVLDLSSQPSRIQAPAPALSPTKSQHGSGTEWINQVIETMRAGDRAEAKTAAGRGTGIDIDDDPSSGTAAYNLLKRASRSGQDITISYVDRNGQSGRRRVRPVTVSGGQVDAIDPASGQVLRFLLHRITEVHLAG